MPEDDADKQPPKPIQLDAQITSAHVLEALNGFKEQVNARFDRLEKTVNESGLNGYTPYLKAFLVQYAATYSSRQAWQTVRADVKHRLRWLAPGKRWLGILIAAILGAIGWGIANHLFAIWPTTGTPPFG